MILPLVALVGRPNVGKSSLFNRLTRSRWALVDSIPGVTRDRQYGEAVWGDFRFRVVDTGGFEPDQGEEIKRLMWDQARLAVEEADVVVLVTDARSGPLPDDYQLAEVLRRSGKPALCVVNKSEGKQGEFGFAEFYALALEQVIAVSAVHGMGTQEFVEAVVERFPESATPQVRDEKQERELKVAVVGCPNAGKSSLINSLLGEERLVTSDVPGTTRDSIDMPFTDAKGRQMTLVDTAGIRRKSRISLRIEKFSVVAAIKAIERAHVAVLVMDAERGVTDQDKRVVGLALEAGKGLVFAINKWDKIKGGHGARKAFSEGLHDAFPHFNHAHHVYLSALTGKGVGELSDKVHATFANGRKRISTGILNRWLQDVVEQHPPPRRENRRVKIRYATQVAETPPTWVVFTNLPDQIHDTYRRYMENQMRKTFGFEGVPLRFMFRKGENPFDKEKGHSGDGQ